MSPIKRIITALIRAVFIYTPIYAHLYALRILYTHRCDIKEGIFNELLTLL